jgi:hypothetical protein
MVHYERYDRRKQRTIEDLRRFMQQDSIQAKSYKWGGSKTTASDKK